MTDTSAAVEARYRALLLALPRERRLKMGFSMLATARALARAGVLEKHPHASPETRRRELFLRFYGHDFAASERERILAWLGPAERPGRDGG
ncbi:MAG: hypothetical protein HYR86_13270 [Candidatus Rokubacteria bacterium]|nr:hypothetical protein [Candidatus Rokubacteria bacterium]